MRSLAAAVIVMLPVLAFAQAPGETTPVVPSLPADEIPPSQQAPQATDTYRVMVAPMIAAFAAFPMSIGDEAGGVVIAKPLWLGKRRRAIQWVLDANVVVGVGHSTHLEIGPQYGFNLYFGRRVGIELRFGNTWVSQLGKVNANGFTLISMAQALVFRFWDDDRRRVKLWSQMGMGAYFKDDPGNDMAMNYGAYVLGLGYETPL